MIRSLKDSKLSLLLRTGIEKEEVVTAFHNKSFYIQKKKKNASILDINLKYLPCCRTCNNSERY